jgi:hypothetical protein
MRKSMRMMMLGLSMAVGSPASGLSPSTNDCGSLHSQVELMARHPEIALACEHVLSFGEDRLVSLLGEVRRIEGQLLLLRLNGANYDLALSPRPLDGSAPASTGMSPPPGVATGQPVRMYVPERRVGEVLRDASTADGSTVPVAIESTASKAARDARIANYTCCPRRRPWYPIVDVLPTTATPFAFAGILGVVLLTVAGRLAHRRRTRH